MIKRLSLFLNLLVIYGYKLLLHPCEESSLIHVNRADSPTRCILSHTIVTLCSHYSSLNLPPLLVHCFFWNAAATMYISWIPSHPTLRLLVSHLRSTAPCWNSSARPNQANLSLIRWWKLLVVALRRWGAGRRKRSGRSKRSGPIQTLIIILLYFMQMIRQKCIKHKCSLNTFILTVLKQWFLWLSSYLLLIEWFILICL